ncbi:MAG: DUF1177 domain-containing protein [Candidatus Tectomicrobia bacterium]|nr:DUF1177 domain-containing protein [Candidatus Tectomicrobia bacterium]
MSLKQVIEISELLDSARVNGQSMARKLDERGWKEWNVETLTSERGSTDFITIVIPGSEGKRGGGSATTLGILGRLGAIGGRPTVVGMVSDADGAIVALSVALKMIDMRNEGDLLKGDVIITTHICPNSPISPEASRSPIPMMGSPVSGAVLREHEVLPEMEAILSIDATKANRVINQKGFAISYPVKEGYILRPSDDLLDIMQKVTGRMPVVFPLATQDITPTFQLRHINSIMTPAASADVPVVGVALTAEAAVPGIATGANHPLDLEGATRFCIEVAKAFGEGKCRFYDPDEFAKIVQLYGSMKHLQTEGRQS